MTSEPQTALPPSPAPGRRPYLQDDPRLRSPVVATLLSAMPGLGQVYLGYYKQGFINSLLVASIIALLAHDVGDFTPLLAIFMAFFWLYNMVDAGRKATLVNLAIHRLESPELPDGFGSMSFRGQIFSGLGLVLAGTLALAHLRFGMPLAWIGDWWPAALVLGGIYLVWQGAAQRRAD